jgi:hypothetical protein
MAPTVGRMVHYVALGRGAGNIRGAHRAAIVAEVGGRSSVTLCVINPTGIHFRDGVVEDPSPTPARTWHWPERE